LYFNSYQVVSNTLIYIFYYTKAAESKTRIQVLLDSVDHCSLTCDGWTSLGQNSYLGVTAHFVHDYTLKSFFLALRHVTQSHTAENLLAELTEVMTEWSLTKKVVTVSADGAFNIAKV